MQAPFAIRITNFLRPGGWSSVRMLPIVRRGRRVCFVGRVHWLVGGQQRSAPLFCATDCCARLVTASKHENILRSENPFRPLPAPVALELVGETLGDIQRRSDRAAETAGDLDLSRW